MILRIAINKLKKLDVSKAILLEELACHTNQLTVLDLNKNTMLKRLEVYNNLIPTIDLTMGIYDGLVQLVPSTTLTLVCVRPNQNISKIDNPGINWSTNCLTNIQGNESYYIKNSIVPNPLTDRFTLAYSVSANVLVTITTLEGYLIDTFILTKGLTHELIFPTHVSPGIYVIKCGTYKQLIIKS